MAQSSLATAVTSGMKAKKRWWQDPTQPFPPLFEEFVHVAFPYGNSISRGRTGRM